MHAVVYVDEALAAKCARDSSHRRFLKGAWSEQSAKRKSNGAIRVSKSLRNGSYKGCIGIKKVRCLMQNAWNLFEKCARHQGRGALFEKSQQILKEKVTRGRPADMERQVAHEKHTQERPWWGNVCFSMEICTFLLATSAPNLGFFGDFSCNLGC